MQSPSVRDLPVPPPSAQEWPWRQGTPPTAAGEWPRISIVTPSFNQAEFLEETIRSVLLQGYPDLEYIIIDGGSTDGSVDIIRKYERWLAYWIAEGDRGQCHAINKGLAQCTGAYFNYVNSDDTLAPGALIAVARAFARHPSAVLVHGRCVLGDEMGRPRSVYQGRTGGFLDTFRNFLAGSGMHPLATFARREAIARVGGYREDLHLEMDLDLWLRLLETNCRIEDIDDCLGTYRCHEEQKSSSPRRLDELLAVLVDGLNRHQELSTGERRALEREAEQQCARRKMWAASSCFQARRYREYARCCIDAVEMYPLITCSPLFWSNAMAPLKALVPARLLEAARRR